MKHFPQIVIFWQRTQKKPGRYSIRAIKCTDFCKKVETLYNCCLCIHNLTCDMEKLYVILYAWFLIQTKTRIIDFPTEGVVLANGVYYQYSKCEVSLP